jgi:hypothetical protein
MFDAVLMQQNKITGKLVINVININGFGGPST